MFDSPPFACFLYCFCLSWMAQGYCFFSFVTVRLSLKKKNWVSFFAEKETSLQDTFLSLWSPRDSFVFVSVTLVLILSCHVLHCLLVAVISLISILGHNFHLTSPFNPDWFLWFLLVEWFCRSCLFGLFISLGEDLLVILSSSLAVSFLLLFYPDLSHQRHCCCISWFHLLLVSITSLLSAFDLVLFFLLYLPPNEGPFFLPSCSTSSSIVGRTWSSLSQWTSYSCPADTMISWALTTILSCPLHFCFFFFSSWMARERTIIRRRKRKEACNVIDCKPMKRIPRRYKWRVR